MKRRTIREILTNNPHELQFSKLFTIDLQNDSETSEEDHFYQI